MPLQDGPVETPTGIQPGDLITGDVGLLVLRALLENGFGYVVSSWRDRPTPIDAAIDDARERVLAQRGITLRRLRSLSAIAPIVQAPVHAAADPKAGVFARGLVVFAGSNGLRPSLEQFVQLDVPGAVVGICYDESAAKITDAVVIDPAITGAGLMDGIAKAASASARSGKPALVLVRPAMLAMRGTVRASEIVGIDVAAARDAASPRGMSVALAGQACGLTSAVGATSALTSGGPVIKTPAAHEQAVRRAVSIISDLDPVFERYFAGAAMVSLLAPKISLVGTDAEQLLANATTQIDIARANNGERIVREIAEWVKQHVSDDVSQDALLELDMLIAAQRTTARREIARRIPRRGEQLYRVVPASVAGALALAQGVIGVPSRSDAAYSTFRTDTGVSLTVVKSEEFVSQGLACAAPGSGHNVFLLIGDGAGAAEMAASAGASIEIVDAKEPRQLAVQIAKACAGMRKQPHVILVQETQRVVPANNAMLGLDPELHGTDRLAVSAIPDDALLTVDVQEELLAGPMQIPVPGNDLAANRSSVTSLSSAVWQLRLRSKAGKSRWLDMSWKLRRRMVRMFAGVDL